MSRKWEDIKAEREAQDRAKGIDTEALRHWARRVAADELVRLGQEQEAVMGPGPYLCGVDGCDRWVPCREHKETRT